MLRNTLRKKRAIHIWRFTGTFTLYLFASLIVYFVTGFSIHAWIVYLFLVTPFYALCLAGTISATLYRVKQNQRAIAYRPALLYGLTIIQLITILLNRMGACKINNNGYIFIQGLLTDASSCTSTPWVSTSVWLVFLGVYALALTAFLADSFRNAVPSD